MSLYTPQIGEISTELLTPADRAQVVADLLRAARSATRSCRCPRACIDVYADPPASPDECIFARTTTLLLGRPRAQDHAVPVRRQSRLRELRLHRLGRTRSRRPPQAARAVIPVGTISSTRIGRGRVREQRCAGAAARPSSASRLGMLLV